MHDGGDYSVWSGPRLLRLAGENAQSGTRRRVHRQAIVREGEADRKVADLCRTHGITKRTYYRWKARYGGMELSEMQRLKQLEDENHL
jgi:transposase-like protein